MIFMCLGVHRGTRFYILFLVELFKMDFQCMFLLVYMLFTLMSYFKCYSDRREMLYSMSVKIICMAWETGAKESLVVVEFDLRL